MNGSGKLSDQDIEHALLITRYLRSANMSPTDAISLMRRIADDLEFELHEFERNGHG